MTRTAAATADAATRPAPVAPPVTTLTVFTFVPGSRAWAFSQMGMARPLLMNVPGLRFHRMMGAGRGLGFTLNPDWGRYAFLGVWDDESTARAFLADSPFMVRYRSRAARASTAVLRTLSAHGKWGGTNPFLPSAGESPQPGAPIGVLTRAFINPLRAGSFWGEVGKVSRRLADAPGLIGSIGVGEAPFFLQATFSLWRSFDDMKAFAYGSPEHRRVIRRTRQERWYGEELFARFAVVERPDVFP